MSAASACEQGGFRNAAGSSRAGRQAADSSKAQCIHVQLLERAQAESRALNRTAFS